MTQTAQEYEWITIAQARERMPIPVSQSTVRRWIEEDKYGIVAKRFAGQILVRADTIPQLRDFFE